MDVVDAHEYFACKTDRSGLPQDIIVELPGGEADVWPAAATAGVFLEVGIAECETTADLDRGLELFDCTRRAGLVCPQKWSRATANIMFAVGMWCERQIFLAHAN